MNCRKLVFWLLWACLIAGVSSCSVSKFIPEDGYLLDRVSLHSDSSSLKTGLLEGYIRQHPNSRWFSTLKVPLGIYSMSGRDSTKRFNRFIRKIGEPPVIYDKSQALKAQQNILSAVHNLGYLNGEVEMLELMHKKKVHLIYRIDPEKRFTVKKLEVENQDPSLDSLLQANEENTLLHEGMNFDLNVLDAERSRINTLMLNNGYYRFNKEFIHFQADTVLGNHQANLKMTLSQSALTPTSTPPKNLAAPTSTHAL